MNQNDVEVTLTLTVQEVNVILAMLGKGQFDVVFPVIGKVKNQAEKQLNSAEPTEPPEQQQLNG